MGKNKKITLVVNRIIPLCLIAFVIIMDYKFLSNWDYIVDSDHSLVYAKILSEEHNLLSKQWFYPTSISVFDQSFLFSFFFMC